MPKVFSPRTLGEFEDASASIPLRRLDRAFVDANIRLGDDADGTGGARRIQFRRYIASVNQHDPQQLERLGVALGSLIEAVATSKEDFLVKAAERDGFFFADGIFQPAGFAASSFALTQVEDSTSIDERSRRLHLIANDSPNDAIAGAMELVDSLCRTVLRSLGKPAPGEGAGLLAIAKSALAALDLIPSSKDDAQCTAAIVSLSLQRLSAIVASFGKLQNPNACDDGRGGKTQGLAPGHARLAIGAAVAFARFVAEAYVGKNGSKNG